MYSVALMQASYAGKMLDKEGVKGAVEKFLLYYTAAIEALKDQEYDGGLQNLE